LPNKGKVSKSAEHFVVSHKVHLAANSGVISVLARTCIRKKKAAEYEVCYTIKIWFFKNWKEVHRSKANFSDASSSLISFTDANEQSFFFALNFPMN
jgi:hypothetical protein